ncbi:MAG: peptide deformylase [Elusimicrobia bacterium]|nr:peptide deformylase [Elusimicrobiota bacterium]
MRKIVIYGEPDLRDISEEVKNITGKVQKIFDDMIDTMYSNSGVGLSAIQIGIPLRMLVINSTGEKKDLICMLNPVILSFSGSVVFREGCLSIPGVFEKLKRPERVVVEGILRSGKKVRMEADGIVARAFQHEIDHMDGKLFVDFVPVYRKIFIFPKLYRIKKKQIK